MAAACRTDVILNFILVKNASHNGGSCWQGSSRAGVTLNFACCENPPRRCGLLSKFFDHLLSMMSPVYCCYVKYVEDADIYAFCTYFEIHNAGMDVLGE